jgi:two-component system phosphate regulon sensor histidine kinase PhoR
MRLRPVLIAFVTGSVFVFAASAIAFMFGQASALVLVVASLPAVTAEIIVLKIFLDGLPELRRSMVRLARNTGQPPNFVSPSPSIDLIWRAALRIAESGNRRALRLQRELDGVTQILTTFPDPLLLINARREVVDVNAAGRELFGEALVRRDLSVAIRNPAILDAAESVLRGGEGSVIDFEIAAPVERQFNARIIPLPRPPAEPADDVSGEFSEDARDGDSDTIDWGGPDRERPVALIVLHDLTAQKRTEQMRVDFVANASHELRTPLSALLGFIETLQGPAADDVDAQRRFLGIMHEQAARMTRLVEDLLSLSRIEMNEHLVPTALVSIASILNNLTQSLQLKAASRSIAMELQLGGDSQEVIGDADELSQVFQNLIDNALKYGRPNSTVTIATRPSARVRGGLAISVSDQGDGIPRIHLPRLTERFYRVDTARSRRLGGTGLGLAIVKHIVNRHRGILEIDSEIGIGSVFTVHLRLAGGVPSTMPESTVLKRGMSDAS